MSDKETIKLAERNLRNLLGKLEGLRCEEFEVKTKQRRIVFSYEVEIHHFPFRERIYREVVVDNKDGGFVAIKMFDPNKR